MLIVLGNVRILTAYQLLKAAVKNCHELAFESWALQFFAGRKSDVSSVSLDPSFFFYRDGAFATFGACVRLFVHVSCVKIVYYVAFVIFANRTKISLRL